MAPSRPPRARLRCRRLHLYQHQEDRFMAISMYHASVPTFLQLLGGLKGIIEKAEKHATEKKWDEATVLNWRLFPDMFTLARQVRQASEHAFGAGRVAGVELPQLPAIDSSFAEMKSRIDKTVDFLKTLKPDNSTAKKIREVTITARRPAARVPRAGAISITSRCRTSISTSRRRTTSCARSASRSASATSWARCRRNRAASDLPTSSCPALLHPLPRSGEPIAG